MAKSRERDLALTLRGKGYSYSQIKEQLRISKSTLSLWLRKYPLTKEQIRKLRDVSEVRIERFRQTMQRKKTEKLARIFAEESKKWLPLSKRELFLAGLFLYWGEGNKQSKGSVGIYNTDPLLMQFALSWLTESLQINKEKIKVRLHLYSDMNIHEEIRFWSQKLKLPEKNFEKPYIKPTKRSSVSYKSFGHGTCALVVHNTELINRLLMAIKAIAGYYQDHGPVAHR